MRVLFLSPRQAWPVTSGAKLRDYHLARAVSQSAELVYLHFEDAGAAPWNFPESGSQRLGVPRPKGYTPWKIVRGLTGKWPLSVLNYMAPEMSEAIRVLAVEGTFDLIVIDALQLAGYLPLLGTLFPQSPVIFDWHNIESELMQRFAVNTPSRAKRIYAQLTARRLETLERSILAASNFAHVVCSERERKQLLALAPQARIGVVPNGVDTEYFAPRETPTVRDALVFVGSMNYHANAEAAVYFVRELWPRLRERFPEWTLFLVGANPGPAVVELASEPRVEVTGTVEDVRPYYHRAAAAVVPLRTGGGTRLKILEALAAGVPVVSTEVGAEGLNVSNGKDILIAENPDQWQTALEFVRVPEQRDALVSSGLDLVRSQYDWNTAGAELVRLYSNWFQTA